MRTSVPALAVLLWLAATANVFAAGEVMEIIPLKYRVVDQVLPVLRPLVPAPGTITGMNNQLIVRTTPEYLEQVKNALARLDTELRRLKISVRQGVSSSGNQSEQALSGRYSKGDVTVGTADPGRGNRGAIAQYRDENGVIRYRNFNREGSHNTGASHFVQVIEGNQAFIRTGQSFPVPQRNVYIGRHHVGVQNSTSYQSASSGFYVRPRVNGDRVTLEISPQLESRSAQHPYAVDTQRVSTVVSGRLGEWIGIGGVNTSSRDSNSENLGTRRRYSSTTHNIQLLVEEAPRNSGRNIFAPAVSPRP